MMSTVKRSPKAAQIVLPDPSSFRPLREDDLHSEEGLIEGPPTPRGPEVVHQPPPSLKQETCIILSFMAFLTLMTGAVLHHFERKRPRRRIVSIQHAFVYSFFAPRPLGRAGVVRGRYGVFGIVRAAAAPRSLGSPGPRRRRGLWDRPGRGGAAVGTL